MFASHRNVQHGDDPNKKCRAVAWQVGLPGVRQSVYAGNSRGASFFRESRISPGYGYCGPASTIPTRPLLSTQQIVAKPAQARHFECV